MRQENEYYFTKRLLAMNDEFVRVYDIIITVTYNFV